MSNTSVVRPYSEQFGRAVRQAASIVQWLLVSPTDDQLVCDKLRIAEYRTSKVRVKPLRGNIRESLPNPEINVAHLHLRNHEPLLQAAEKLGYRQEPLTNSSRSRRRVPAFRLSNGSGDRLVITREGGQLAVCSAGDASKIHALVRQHTLERAMEHFAGKGMQVKTAVLPNGEFQIQAKEPSAKHRGGPARITTKVCEDGTAVVDVDGVRGNRCSEISAAIASALGGQLSTMNVKSSYYQIPVETGHVQVKG